MGIKYLQNVKKLVSQLKIEKDISMRKRRHDGEKKTIICSDGAMVFAVTLFLMGNFINYSFIGCSPMSTLRIMSDFFLFYAKIVLQVNTVYAQCTFGVQKGNGWPSG